MSGQSDNTDDAADGEGSGKPRGYHTYRDEGWLLEHYWGEGKSIRNMATLAECSTTTISTWMDHYAIERRTPGRPPRERARAVALATPTAQRADGGTDADGDGGDASDG